jgi:hypothetical protein
MIIIVGNFCDKKRNVHSFLLLLYVIEIDIGFVILLFLLSLVVWALLLSDFIYIFYLFLLVLIFANGWFLLFWLLVILGFLFFFNFFTFLMFFKQLWNPRLLNRKFFTFVFFAHYLSTDIVDCKSLYFIYN